MKYIKNYSSLIVESVKDDLQEFCEMNLAYLLDEDFVMDVIPSRNKGFIISFGIRNIFGDNGVIVGNDTDGFTWNEIENHFIPFLQRLSHSYKIVSSIMVKFQQGYPYAHESIIVKPTSMMNHDLMLERFGDKLIRNISILVENV